jgi:hypothetical protein
MFYSHNSANSSLSAQCFNNPVFDFPIPSTGGISAAFAGHLLSFEPPWAPCGLIMNISLACNKPLESVLNSLKKDCVFTAPV